MKLALGLLTAAMILSPNVQAYDPKEVTVTGHDLPQELQGVGPAEKLGSNIDLNLQFTDDRGQLKALSTLFSGDKPVLLAMVYYDCPSLCNFHLNGVTDALKTMKWNVGEQFDLVAVSMNHRETSELAARKKQNYVAAYGRVQTANGWHFLVGDQASVKSLADQLGFQFKWLPEKEQFAHASVTYILTPQGKISRIINGIQPDPNTLRLSLLEASDGKIGTVIEQALMFCFQFNPEANKYVLYAWNLMRIGAILMILVLAVVFVPVWRRAQLNRPRT
jgi:protein SCO1/2